MIECDKYRRGKIEISQGDHHWNLGRIRCVHSEAEHDKINLKIDYEFLIQLHESR
jgi:hypothetical protein